MNRFTAVSIALFVVLSSLPAAADDGVSAGLLEGAPEQLRLLPTYAAYSPDGESLVIPVHVWAFEEESDLLRRKAIEELAEKLGVRKGTKAYAIFERRMVAFMVDNESGVEVEVRVDGPGVVSTKVDLGETPGNGHLEGVVKVPIDPKQKGKVTSVKVVAAAEDDDVAPSMQVVEVVPPTGVTVVSDIDDTIKITGVVDKKELIANSFMREFRAVPAMAKRFEKWAVGGAQFHYVSASPWNLFDDLRAFVKRAGFPEGVYHLRIFRARDLRRTVEFIKGSRKHKIRTISELMRRFPKRDFILVGDTGEKDPEIYGEIARTFPGQIRHIYLRRVEGAKNESARFEAGMKGVPKEKWTIVTDPEQEESDQGAREQ